MLCDGLLQLFLFQIFKRQELATIIGVMKPHMNDFISTPTYSYAHSSKFWQIQPILS